MDEWDFVRIWLEKTNDYPKLRKPLYDSLGMNPDGSGPGYCFADGETEDYYDTPCIDNDEDGFNGSSWSDCGPFDCDDSNPDVHPGALEVCDGIDNDCDGLIDEVPLACSDPDMVSYWRFDERGGSTTNDSADDNSVLLCKFGHILVASVEKMNMNILLKKFLE